jgi:hypothetical protein
MSNMEEYAQTTKHICCCFGLIASLTLFFIVSPISNFKVISFFGKLFIICVIVYLIKYNVETNYSFYKKYQDLNVGNDSTIQMNILTNCVFVVVLFILCLSILSTFFTSNTSTNTSNINLDIR